MNARATQFKRLSFILILVMVFSLLSIGSAKANGIDQSESDPPDRMGSGAICDQDPYCEVIDPGSNSGNFTAPGAIVSFSVKTGSNLITYTPPGTSTSELAFCWTVSISGDYVTWSRVESSSTCQDPSHFEIYWEDVDYASADADVLACVEGKDTEPVYLSVTGATMTVTGPGALEEVLNSGDSGIYYDWPVGTYSITYELDPGKTDPGDLPSSFVIGDCVEKEDAEAEAEVEACMEGSITTPVNLSVTGATMNITGPKTHSLSSGESELAKDWPVGTYSISYVFDEGYQDPGNLPTGFVIGDCSKTDAEAEAEVEACVTGSTTTPVSLSVTGARMNITGPQTYTLNSGESELVTNWPMGTYSITYDNFDEGYQDPGNLPSGFTIEDCSEKEEADASATVEACIEGSTSTPVVLWVEGASMHITRDGDAGFGMDHSGGPFTYKNLEPDTYHIAYTFDEDHKDPGTLPTSFVIEECETDKGFADLSITVKCIYDPNNTCHRWTVSNPNDFPVDFEWSTGAKSGGYSETGGGTVGALGIFEFNTSYVSQSMVVSYSDGEVVQVVTVDTGVCTTDEEEPDEPAGGSGPSLISTLTPSLLLVSCIGIAWILIKHKVKNM